MNVLKRRSVAELLLAEPKLKKFTERQIEVAQTWSQHFDVADSVQTLFIHHYLGSTAKTRCWCVPLGSSEQAPRPVLARMGRQLQYFDGTTIKAYAISPRDHIQQRKPSAKAAEGLLLRLVKGWHESPILTSFCRAASEMAQTLASDDLGRFCGRYVSTSGRDKRYFAPRSRFYLTQLGSTLKQFCQCLDQDILFAIRSVQCPSPLLYNWLAQGNSRRRLQALKAQPVLIPLLVMREEAPWPWDENERGYLSAPWDDLQRWKPEWIDESYMVATGFSLAAHIADTGLPLIHTLAWLLGVPRMSIRYLGQQRVFDTGNALSHIRREGPLKAGNALLVGATLGNRRPATKTDWKVFVDVLDKLPWQLHEYISDFNTLLSGCPTSWNDPEWPIIAANIYDLSEIFSRLEQDNSPVNRRALQHVKHFMATASYRQIASLVNDFHLALTEIRAALNASESHIQSDALTFWAPLLQEHCPILCPNGLQIIELTCPADLEAEHLKLGHCIQTYDYSAYRGNCRLVSVRLNGESLASAEIQLREKTRGKKPPTWTLQHLATTQLRGHRNDVPKRGSPVYVAYQWFWARLTSGGFSLNLEWPDMTGVMSRYASRDRNAKLAHFCAKWINKRME